MPSADSISDSEAGADSVSLGSPTAVAVPATPEPNRQGYDFRTPPTLLSPAQSRHLKMRHEEFARSLATRLSIYLRLEINVQVAQLQTIRFRQWADSIAAPTHLTLFRVDKIEGTSFLEIPPALGLTLLDRLLGGKGSTENPTRDLTQIETAVVDEIILIILREWCPYGLNVADAKPCITQHENNPRFLEALPGETNMLVISLTVEINGSTNQIAIALPLVVVEPLLQHLIPPADPKRPVPRDNPPVMKWNSELDHVNVPLTAGWAGFEISARRLAQLEVGDFLPLDASVVNHVEVRLAQVPKFIGLLGAAGKTRAIKLTSKVTA
jgi:flagellar motor switch protein FliM